MKTDEDRKIAEEEHIIMLEHCGNDRFDEYFEYISSRANSFEDIYYAYLECRDEIAFTEYTFDKSNNPLIVYNKVFEDRQRKLDIAFLKYTENITPQVIKDLIAAGQLGQKMINGKYKPTFEITDFMEWLSNNSYEDYLEFGFFKKFIFYENTDGTIKQYLKPCNYGIKRQKKVSK